MFLKRRRAVAAAVVLAALFLVAVWTPLLASAKPLRFRGVDKGAATQAARVARLEIQDLARAFEGKEAAWTRGKAATSFGVVAFQLGRMEVSLRDELSATVRSIREEAEAIRARTGGGAPGEPLPEDREAAKALAALAARIKSDLKPVEADLLARTRWPAFRGITAWDAFLMAASLAAPAGLWLLRRRPGMPRRTRAAARAVLLPALAAAVLWGAFGPSGEDSTDYKRGLREGTLVAESVVFPPVPFDLNENDMERRFEAPLLRPPDPPAAAPGAPGPEAHLLGTDENGRDMLCRMLWGARVSLAVGFVAVGIYVLIGVVVGAVAGYFRGWVDIVVSRFIEWVICFPVFVLILVIVAFLQDRTLFGVDPPQLVVVMVVIGVTGWTTVARLVRAEFLRLVEEDFVRAARALGAVPSRVIFGHVLPNAMAPVLVAAAFGVAGAILTESALSFLGLGVNVPRPSWGGMLNSARGYETSSVWIVLWPGLAIFLVITCYNLVGEALRDALDPRLRQ
jgi:peptide/nickel transport system permease protein